MENCTSGCWATSLFVLGIVLILIRIYTAWDIWVVIGAILIIKGILVFLMPKCCCQNKLKLKR